MPKSPQITAESKRLSDDAARRKNWKRWGPYLSERQWATVREDYSKHGTCWEYFPHDHARSRAYRWGEDGLLGITDRQCRLCFALCMWNGRDAILKERLFGLTGNEGNHGEDVKEEYFYLESTPTHSYMKGAYLYPRLAYPYSLLVRENGHRSNKEPEFELLDTEVFQNGGAFDVVVEYAKHSPNDVLIQTTVTNHGKENSLFHFLPTLWFRNTWSWDCTHEGCSLKPRIQRAGDHSVTAQHESLGRFLFFANPANPAEQFQTLFTDNETNSERLFKTPNPNLYVKDAFHRYVIQGDEAAVNPNGFGTKSAFHYTTEIQAGQSVRFQFRLTREKEAPSKPFGGSFDSLFAKRRNECDEFYGQLTSKELPPEKRAIVRQGFAGLLWTKQFYHFIVKDWLKGDPGMPAPPAERKKGRNRRWGHLYNRDVLSMPDKWEYPWFAAWDLAFHMIPFAEVDGAFAKQQLGLLLREWYMHPNGQIPAYEFAFGDVNPPVHAWAAWRVYKIADPPGRRDRHFLESVFQKLLLNFTWWVNRKDENGNNLFAGGFLGLDNIGVFDRSKPLPNGGTLQQADGTAWMAFYCATMLAMALELARDGDQVRTAYEDMASKFFEHFVQIIDAMNAIGGRGLWDDEDGFYYDQLKIDGKVQSLKTRSMVGLLPLIAVEILDENRLVGLPGFYKRFQWFLKHQPGLSRHITACSEKNHLRLLSICSPERLRRTLRYLLDEDEFLSPFGIRSLSRYHREHPFELRLDGTAHRVEYVPGESDTWLFGGNSNWRGPVWFPVNYLILEALERCHHFFGEDFQVELPTGSGRSVSLKAAADEIAARLVSLFLPDSDGIRPCIGEKGNAMICPDMDDRLLFHEYFHAETGKGLGASHQTGWTALITRLILDQANR